MNNIDLPALRGLTIQAEAEITALKRVLRRTWPRPEGAASPGGAEQQSTRPMAAEQKTLHALKLRATRLYVVRALMRGRLHLAARDRAHHEAVAAETVERYSLCLKRAI